jgi:hypothetical protein
MLPFFKKTTTHRQEAILMPNRYQNKIAIPPLSSLKDLSAKQEPHQSECEQWMERGKLGKPPTDASTKNTLDGF